MSDRAGRFCFSQRFPDTVRAIRIGVRTGPQSNWSHPVHRPAVVQPLLAKTTCRSLIAMPMAGRPVPCATLWRRSAKPTTSSAVKRRGSELAQNRIKNERQRLVLCRLMVDIMQTVHGAYAPGSEPFGTRTYSSRYVCGYGTNFFAAACPRRI
jgi:hypothetical protein